MKYLLPIILLTVFAFGQTDAPPSETIPIDQANQKKAQGIIDQAIQALGGQAYLDIRDISQEGRTYSFHHGTPTSNGLQFWRFYRYPDKDRIELTKKRDVIELFNGDKGWEITYKGAQAQAASPSSMKGRRSLRVNQWIKSAS